MNDAVTVALEGIAVGVRGFGVTPPPRPVCRKAEVF